MRHAFLCTCALWLLAGPAVAADDTLPGVSGSLTNASDLASAAQDLAGMAQDRLLIKDLLGRKLTGNDGETVGTIENFVVIPGGRLVAAVVETGDGTRIAVPFAAVKLASAAQGAGVQATLPASELKGMSELKSLADSLTN